MPYGGGGGRSTAVGIPGGVAAPPLDRSTALWASVCAGYIRDQSSLSLRFLHPVIRRSGKIFTGGF